MENYSFVLSEQEASIVIAALAKQPYEVVASIIQKVQAQAAKQQNDKKIMEAAAGSVAALDSK
jgi:uncharacterized membrane-anchored protein